MISWIYFIILTTLGYIGVAIFSKMVGGEANSLTETLKNIFTPLPLCVMVVANVFLGAAIYYGFLSTQLALPIMLSLGVMVTSVYSVLFLGVTFTVLKVVGLLFIVVGIYLLR